MENPYKRNDVTKQVSELASTYYDTRRSEIISFNSEVLLA